MKYLLDTNTASEPKRKRPDPNAEAWLKSVDQNSLYLSVLTIGEIENGIARLARRDPASATVLSDWAQGIRRDFSDRIVGIDLATAEIWGRLTAVRPLPIVDSLLAATALAHGMTLVTRNTRDVADTGVPLLNPWEA